LLTVRFLRSNEYLALAFAMKLLFLFRANPGSSSNCFAICLTLDIESIEISEDLRCIDGARGSFDSVDSGDSASIFETGVVSVGVGKSFSSGVERTGVDAGTGVVGGIGVVGGKGVGGLRLFILACMTSFSTFCQLCL
jgi:hypothetical protein